MIKISVVCQPFDTDAVCCSDASDYKRVLEVNTVGPFLATQAFYPLLLKRDTRTIVNVSSGLGSISANRSGETPLSGKIISYCSSKAALNMRTRLALTLFCILLKLLHDHEENLLISKKVCSPPVRTPSTCVPLHLFVQANPPRVL